MEWGGGMGGFLVTRNFHPTLAHPSPWMRKTKWCSSLGEQSPLRADGDEIGALVAKNGTGAAASSSSKIEFRSPMVDG